MKIEYGGGKAVLDTILTSIPIMKTKPKIEIPDTSTGAHLVCVRGTWHSIYFVDGKRLRRSTRVKCRKAALKIRDKFYSDLLHEGASVRSSKSIADKLKRKPDLFIYRRKPYVVVIKGTFIGEAETHVEAVDLRNEFLKSELGLSLEN